MEDLQVEASKTPVEDHKALLALTQEVLQAARILQASEVQVVVA